MSRAFVSTDRMHPQVSLPGFESAPCLTDNVFFAVLPEPPAVGCIDDLTRRLRAELGLVGRPLPRDRLHVTQHHLGHYAGVPREVIERANAAAVMVEMSPFEVVFDRVCSFRRGAVGKLPLVLRGGDGIAALAAFRQRLSMSLKKVGFVRGEAAGLTPHVTLLYDDRLVAERAVEPIAWTVREFVLIDSLTGLHRHEHLGRWPLRG